MTTTASELLVSGIPHIIRKSKRIRAITDKMAAMGVSECIDRRGELIERLHAASSQQKIVEKVGQVSRERVERWVDRGIDATLKKFGDGRKIDRTVFRRRRELCQSCEHYKRSCETKGWMDGCNLLEKPCSVELRWMSDDDEWCPIGCGKSRPTSPSQKVTEFVAVTSLSRWPHHISRQVVCLDSWKSFGLEIVAINQTDEVDDLRSMYPQVDRWIREDEVSQEFARPTQYIHRLARVACAIGKPVMVINSDVEIYGDKSAIVDRMGDRSLVAGIRWNYPGQDYALARRERFGIDAFLLTPTMAESLPRLPFAIGRPVWDYWLPVHFRDAGYTMEFIGSPLIYHQSHAIYWSKDDWNLAGKWLNDTYGINVEYDSHEFRASLPFPPK